jgi:hypothetical protein
VNVKTFRQFLPPLGNSSKEPMNTPKSTFECKTGFVVNCKMSQLIRLSRGHNTLFAAACEQSHPCQCLNDPGADAIPYSATKGRLARKKIIPTPHIAMPKCRIAIETTFLATGNRPLRRPYSVP